ncbi:GH12 family glycosyl hydrolase domain-containing protein [Ohtaekwangia koreensis]|uniref:Glycosyl hydrolase family 12 n=1 Tax=Ohtaekwangia koreensis TaxID=688867 RepID=A0A1T5MHS7_9BACT|nr:glycosyl hydrolase [Ohtaekwangia koreensis]SKC87449.1 Glycosyl hydrolase family 12 [Ohtaekwangia koreensis]
MKNIFAFLIMASLVLACQTEEVQPSNTEVLAAWGSSAQYATWSNGGYTLYNNIWGSGAGAQSIWANSYSNWGVWANHPNTNGIKSYPNCTRYVGRTLSSLNTCSTSYNITTPAGGAWTAAYDVWDSGKQHEIMLWMNYTSNPNGSGNIKPISYNWNASGNPVPTHTNVSIGGHTWNVFRGNNGSNHVYSFLRTSKTNSATINLKDIMNWVRARGWFGDITVGDVQLGYEITSSSGGLNYVTNSYSVSFN